MLELRILSYDGSASQPLETVVLGPEGGSFGRSRDNTLALNDPDRLVSRRQGRIDYADSQFVLTNLSSSNSILVNDNEVAPDARITLSDGDQIRTGRFMLGVCLLKKPLPLDSLPEQNVAQTDLESSDSSLDPLAAFAEDQKSPAPGVAELTGISEPQISSLLTESQTPFEVSSQSPSQTNTPGVADFPGLKPKPSPSSEHPAQLSKGNIQAISDWSSNVSLPKTEVTRHTFIPEDFNPFDLPSLAQRNTHNPLTSTKFSLETNLENLTESVCASSRELLDDLPKPALEPIQDPLESATGHTELLADVKQEDPLTLFEETTPLSILDSSRPAAQIGDCTPEISSSFHLSLITPRTSDEAYAPAPIAEQVSRSEQTEATTSVHADAVSNEPLEPNVNSHLSEGTVNSSIPKRDAAPKENQTTDTCTVQPPRELLEAFLSGAGLKEALVQELTPEYMFLIGKLLSEAVQGTVELMQARALTKRELRAQVTLIAPKSNNPLKFAPDGHAALNQLVGKRFPGFMPPIEAMEDAFNDLRAHQIGMTAGMRAALQEVLSRFSPESLEQRISQHSLLETVLPATRKSRLWDTYTELFQLIRSEAEDKFHALFGEAFLKTYDEEVARLSRRDRP